LRFSFELWMLMFPVFPGMMLLCGVYIKKFELRDRNNIPVRAWAGVWPWRENIRRGQKGV